MSDFECERLTPPSTPPPRKFGLKWVDFQYEGDLEDLPDTAKLPKRLSIPLLRTLIEHTVAKLREERYRFMTKVPNDLHSRICCPRDRSAVLDVYAEALDRINSINHQEVYTEANTKIRIILSIVTASPRNDAFYKGFLSPIEPLYARPRIEFCKDKYGHRAATRIQEWRNDGWPDRYPEHAIEAEKARKGHLKRWYEEDWTDRTIGGLDEKKEQRREGENESQDEMEWMIPQA